MIMGAGKEGSRASAPLDYKKLTKKEIFHTLFTKITSKISFKMYYTILSIQLSLNC
jgi:hypothetical protein